MRWHEEGAAGGTLPQAGLLDGEGWQVAGAVESFFHGDIDL